MHTKIIIIVQKSDTMIWQMEENCNASTFFTVQILLVIFAGWGSTDTKPLTQQLKEAITQNFNRQMKQNHIFKKILI